MYTYIDIYVVFLHIYLYFFIFIQAITPFLFNKIDRYASRQRMRGAAIRRRNQIDRENGNTRLRGTNDRGTGDRDITGDRGTGDRRNDSGDGREINSNASDSGNDNNGINNRNSNNGFTVNRDFGVSSSGASATVSASSSACGVISTVHDTIGDINAAITNDNINTTNINKNTTHNSKYKYIKALKDTITNLKTNCHTKIKKSTQAILRYMIIFQNNIYKGIDFTIIKMSQLYPYLKIIYKLLVLSQKILYLYGYSTHIHPVLSILNISLIKNQPREEDKKNNLDTNERPQMPPATQESNDIRNLNIGGGAVKKNGKFLSLISSEWKSILIISALISIRTVEFLLRSQRPQGSGSNSIFQSFSNFFSSNSSSNNIENTNRTVPSVPKPMKVVRGGIIPPSITSNLCPICRKKKKNPCVASSGYVFCYLCLIRYIYFVYLLWIFVMYF